MSWKDVDEFGKNLMSIGFGIIILAILFAFLWRK